MTILAFGCSVTHGAETVTPGNNKDNIPFSYPAVLARRLGVDCENFAFCGNSNENIFHQAMSTIPQHDNITAVVIGWTGLLRETWTCDGRIWQFIPSWAATCSNLYRNYVALEEGNDDRPRYCADKGRLIADLKEIYPVLVKYKFDKTEYQNKLDTYMTAVRSYCQVKGIKLVETWWDVPLDGVLVDLNSVSDWKKEMPWRHPNAFEHEKIADQIQKHYNL